MRAHRLASCVLAVLVPLVVGCGGGGSSDEPAPVPSMTTDADVFAEDVLHYVEITVAEEDLPRLVPFTEERVPCTFVYDGTSLSDVGIRIKGGAGSARPVGQKPGFSVKTNEFVKGQKLKGYKKLLLNNAVQDPSFLSEFMAYEVFRRAGVPVRRIGHARVRFNGEYLGVYAVVEPYDDGFLGRTYADGDGNLYEGTYYTDVTDVDAMQLDTNEDANDRSDLRELAAVLFETSDDDLPTALETVVDVEAFLTYWAVEALTRHWDGYAGYQEGSGRSQGPSNYYVYHDPSTSLFHWLAHGADRCFDDAGASVLMPPSEHAVLARRCFDHPGLRARFLDRLREVLAVAWDPVSLEARVDAALTRIEGSVAEGDQNLGWVRWPQFRDAVGALRGFLRDRPGRVLGEIGD